jgi:hypothetical protein
MAPPTEPEPLSHEWWHGPQRAPNGSWWTPEREARYLPPPRPPLRRQVPQVLLAALFLAPVLFGPILWLVAQMGGNSDAMLITAMFCLGAGIVVFGGGAGADRRTALDRWWQRFIRLVTVALAVGAFLVAGHIVGEIYQESHEAAYWQRMECWSVAGKSDPLSRHIQAEHC